MKDMTIQEIMNTPWEERMKWDAKQVSHATRTLSLAANKRLSILEKHEKWKDIAVSGLYDHGQRVTKFGAGRKRKDETNKQFRNRAMAELKRAESFLKRKDTTYTKANEMLHDTANYFKIDSSNLSDEQLFDLTQKSYDVFNKLVETDPNFIFELYKYDNLMNDIGQYFEENPDASPEDALKIFNDQLEQNYIDMQNGIDSSTNGIFDHSDMWDMLSEEEIDEMVQDWII